MPHPTPNQPPTGPGLPPKAASPSEAPNPGPSAPDDTPPKPGVKGALFRALVDAGADPLVAYTADEQAESMVSERVAVQVQPILANIRHQFAEHGRKLDALDALTEAGAEYGRKLDALAEGPLSATGTGRLGRGRRARETGRPGRGRRRARSEAGRNRRGDPWTEGSDWRQGGRAEEGIAADLGRPGCPAHRAYRGLRLPVHRLNPGRLNPVRRLQSLLLAACDGTRVSAESGEAPG